MDIAPELKAAIQRDFGRYVAADKTIQRALEKAESGKADYRTAYTYATALGTCLSRAFSANLSDDVLPDGHMYYNIAERAVEPFLTAVEDMVAAYCDMVQTDINEKAGIGLKPV